MLVQLFPSRVWIIGIPKTFVLVSFRGASIVDVLIASSSTFRDQTRHTLPASFFDVGALSPQFDHFALLCA
jgi:hypothetical protein